VTRILTRLGIALSLLSNRSWTFWSSQLHPSVMGLGKTYGNRLLRRTRTMLTLSNVVYLFANEFSRLSGRRLALAGIFSGSFNCFALRHNSDLLELSSVKPSIGLGRADGNPTFTGGQSDILCSRL